MALDGTLGLMNPFADMAVGGCFVQLPDVPSEPNTAISVMLAQLFSVFPFTIILTYLPSVPAGNVYFSVDVVLPLLVPVNLFVNVLPLSETDMTKLFSLKLPRYHATSDCCLWHLKAHYYRFRSQTMQPAEGHCRSHLALFGF